MTINVKGQKEEINYKVPSVVLFKQELFNDNYNYRQVYNKANPKNPLVYKEKEPQDNSFLLNMIPTIILLGVMIFFFIYTIKQAGGGGKIGQFGKSNAKNHLNKIGRAHV